MTPEQSAEQLKQFWSVFDGIFAIPELWCEILQEVIDEQSRKISEAPVILAYGGQIDFEEIRLTTDTAEALINLIKARQNQRDYAIEKASNLL